MQPPLEQIAALPGVTSVLLAPLNGERAALAHNADEPLAIGSTFKLYVLSALVRRSRRASAIGMIWCRSIRSSYPSGVMQDWEPGTLVSLRDLAEHMIASATTPPPIS